VLGLIVTVIFGLGIAYFSIQNTATVAIHFNQYTWSNIPLYIVIVGSLLTGIVIAGIISFANFISSKIILHGKENTIKETKQLVANLTRNLHQLELENATLKAKDAGILLEDDDKSL